MLSKKKPLKFLKTKTKQTHYFQNRNIESPEPLIFLIIKNSCPHFGSMNTDNTVMVMAGPRLLRISIHNLNLVAWNVLFPSLIHENISRPWIYSIYFLSGIFSLLQFFFFNWLFAYSEFMLASGYVFISLYLPPFLSSYTCLSLIYSL